MGLLSDNVTYKVHGHRELARGITGRDAVAKHLVELVERSGGGYESLKWVDWMVGNDHVAAIAQILVQATGSASRAPSFSSSSLTPTTRSTRSWSSPKTSPCTSSVAEARTEGGQVRSRPPEPGTKPVTGQPPVRLLIADVDGTLITKEKVLTDRAIAAVAKLKSAGVLFALVSGRPPRGMAMFVEPLEVTTPIAAFEGGLLVNPDMSVIERRTVPSDLVTPISDLLSSYKLVVWLYQGSEWLIPDRKGPHVDQEAATVEFQPTVRSDLRLVTDGIVKMVGVSDDYAAVEKAAAAAHDRFGDHVSAARSQPYYVDVTHPDANKGVFARYLSTKYSIPEAEIATIGDMPNDILMFAHSGLSIAMGNADPQVQRCARRRHRLQRGGGLREGCGAFHPARNLILFARARRHSRPPVARGDPPGSWLGTRPALRSNPRAGEAGGRRKTTMADPATPQAVLRAADRGGDLPRRHGELGRRRRAGGGGAPR